MGNTGKKRGGIHGNSKINKAKPKRGGGIHQAAGRGKLFGGGGVAGMQSSTREQGKEFGEKVRKAVEGNGETRLEINEP